LRKTKIDDVIPVPASAKSKLSPRKRKAGVQSEKLDSRSFDSAQGKLSFASDWQSTFSTEHFAFVNRTFF